MPASEPEPERGPPPEPTHAGGRCGTWRSLARVCSAELAGTALLVLLSTAGASDPSLAPLRAGLVVAALVQCFGGVSGAQLNPCVSLAAAWCGRMNARRAAAELCAQLAGATLGAAAAAACSLGPTWQPDAALTLLAPHCPVFKALLVEGVCGACVVLANCAQWHDADVAAHTWPLRIGSVVAALAIFATPLTGASMNPARSFGPALIAAQWDHHWVYWAGPLGGAAAAVVIYRSVWRPLAPDSSAAGAGDCKPLPRDSP